MINLAGMRDIIGIRVKWETRVWKVHNWSAAAVVLQEKESERKREKL